MQDHPLQEAEREIDLAAADNLLAEFPSHKAMWTLLSVNEDVFYKCYTQNPELLPVFSDIRLNAINHPLKYCLLKGPRSSDALALVLVDKDYSEALEWIELSENYTDFCTIFTLWHQKNLNISLDRNIIHADYSKHGGDYNFAHQAYNRMYKPKNAKTVADSSQLKMEKAFNEVRRHTRVQGSKYTLNYSPQLVKTLYEATESLQSTQFELPSHWEFNGFTLAEYKVLFFTLRAMMQGWFWARLAALELGVESLGYCSSVWVAPKEELIMRLKRYTGLEATKIKFIVNLITFGSSGIRHPDIAYQPIVDMDNDFYALSPFVFMSNNAERNLCVLLNKVPTQKDVYSRLVDEKEEHMRNAIKNSFSKFECRFVAADLPNTDVDIAIIDDKNRICLCLELKWFIAPAELREIKEKHEELAKGILQAEELLKLFDKKDHNLFERLCINETYSFQASVISHNWIGHDYIQVDEVTVANHHHLLEKVDLYESLQEVLTWLKHRSFLPNPETGFEIMPVSLSCGRWKTEWYGINPLIDGLD